MSGDNLFPGQHTDEKIAFFFQKHWIELLYPIGRFLIEQIIIGLVALFVYFREEALAQTTEGRIIAVMVALALLATTFTFWIRLFNYFLRMVIVTEYRIIDVNQKLFLTMDEDVIDMREVQDFKAEIHGFFRNLLQCGSLTFILSATSTPKTLHNVSRPHRIADKISEVREIYRKLGASSGNNQADGKGL